ncbi:MAG: transposase [Desulfovibrio sp.]|nr:transposase [Desulfovibrio sp.]
MLYVTENSCKWRALPKSFGNWHTVYDSDALQTKERN